MGRKNQARVALVAMCCAALSIGCPTRAGTQLGEGDETVHDRLSRAGARAFVIERADQLLSGVAG